MAKMMSNECIFSACNHGFDMKKIDKVSVGMIKLPTLSNLASSLTLRESSAGEFFGRPVTLRGQERRAGAQVAAASDAKMINGIGKSLRWWEKGLQPNMKEITGAEDLVESLSQAGDQLVVVDFFSPGCGGCKALHPKICQLAEMNPDVQFLQVNYEDHKSMCYSLNVHVLPFFRFYRGAEGRVCSFSCTNATIKKFKDALARYKPDRCGLGPPKGLEEKELIALGANRDLSFVYTPKGLEEKELTPPPLPSLAVAGSQSKLNAPLPLPLPRSLKSTSEMKKDSKDNTLVSFGR
uniref:thioredoxin-like 1-1, chloroplastic isoform X1 n=1 Tax=Erigeron canadensis TaxID=72917 RepID=UPI001CB96629|nr:thioredoxin-like 1-1, chloroplastic isoform X1 [Erigeron canadensis]